MADEKRLTNEQLEALPYGRPGAKPSDVVKELRTYVTLIAGVMAVDPSGGAAQIADESQGAGKLIGTQGVRLALALTSWSHGLGDDLLTVLFEQFQDPPTDQENPE